MTTKGRTALLGPDDPAPVSHLNANGRSPFLLIGDHAGIAFPQSLGTLGLGAEDIGRHIACDIGVLGLGRLLSRSLDAMFIHQHYSRLVIDCNRDPASLEAIPARSDGSDIPGNRDVGADARGQRIAAIHAPYHKAIAQAIERRAAANLPSVLVALHSFTPEMAGVRRPWHYGVLHDGANDRFALASLAALRGEADIVVGDNEPYRMDATDHSVPRHAFARDLPYLELEVRQDLLGDEAGRQRSAALLERVLRRAWDGSAA